MAYESLNIDVPRLFEDLSISEDDMRQVRSLDIPHDIRVTSVSAIKTDVVRDTFDIIAPDEYYDIQGIKSPSGVAEQPLGQTAIDGALNRLHNGMRILSETAPDESAAAAWVSIENGLFRVAPHDNAEGLYVATDISGEGTIQSTEQADLTTSFDPDAEYEDRAVAVLQLPGHPTLIQVSPSTEAVPFPKAAVLAAYNAKGSFDEHTAGSKLAEMGLVKDEQNPHSELTANRTGGPLPRQEQMARVILRALLRLAI